MSERPYEIVLLGATGYTGQFTAKYVQEHVSPDLKWAIAGRDSARLQQLADELEVLQPTRVQPGTTYRSDWKWPKLTLFVVIEVTTIDHGQLLSLAGKTKVLITTLGPYAKFGEPVVKACVEAGTHYLDVYVQILLPPKKVVKLIFNYVGRARSPSHMTCCANMEKRLKPRAFV
jgi:short subunit dehydrogenase-like uncharacterized protein